MKSNHWLLTVALTFIVLQVKADSWIRINQLGYLPQSVKVAVFMSEEPADIQEYALIDAFTGQTVRTFNSTKATGKRSEEHTSELHHKVQSRMPSSA